MYLFVDVIWVASLPPDLVSRRACRPRRYVQTTLSVTKTATFKSRLQVRRGIAPKVARVRPCVMPVAESEPGEHVRGFQHVPCKRCV